MLFLRPPITNYYRNTPENIHTETCKHFIEGEPLILDVEEENLNYWDARDQKRWQAYQLFKNLME